MKDPKFIDVGGIRTRYFEAGEGDPLVLIHGGHIGKYSSAYDWSLNFDELSARFHVYALDKIGQGYTDNPADDARYTMTDTIEHVYQFLLAARVGRAVLMGHSRGALPAARIAVDHPEQVSALIVIDSNTLAPDHPSTPAGFYANLGRNAPPAPNEEYVRREPEANSHSFDHITDEFVSEMLSIANLPKTQEARKKMDHLLGHQFVPDVQNQKYATLDLVRDGGLESPTLVLWGLQDPSAPIGVGLRLYEHIALAVPRTHFIALNKAGHYVFREHPGDVDRAVVAFVEGSGSSQ